jgi:hypothetical protein
MIIFGMNFNLESLRRFPCTFVPRKVEGIRLWPGNLLGWLVHPVVPAHLLDEGYGLLLGGKVNLKQKKTKQYIK